LFPRNRSSGSFACHSSSPDAGEPSSRIQSRIQARRRETVFLLASRQCSFRWRKPALKEQRITRSPAMHRASIRMFGESPMRASIRRRMFSASIRAPVHRSPSPRTTQSNLSRPMGRTSTFRRGPVKGKRTRSLSRATLSGRTPRSSPTPRIFLPGSPSSADAAMPSTPPRPSSS
jgi:hypothetical protein